MGIRLEDGLLKGNAGGHYDDLIAKWPAFGLKIRDASGWPDSGNKRKKTAERQTNKQEATFSLLPFINWEARSLMGSPKRSWPLVYFECLLFKNSNFVGMKSIVGICLKGIPDFVARLPHFHLFISCFSASGPRHVFHFPFQLPRRDVQLARFSYSYTFFPFGLTGRIVCLKAGMLAEVEVAAAGGGDRIRALLLARLHAFKSNCEAALCAIWYFASFWPQVRGLRLSASVKAFFSCQLGDLEPPF